MNDPTMRRLLPLALLAALALAPRASLAQTSPPPAGDAPPATPGGSAAAEALFQQGRSLLAEGKTADACARFAESQRLEAKLGTLLNLALCHETMGLHATAWAEFTSAATLAGRDGQADRQAFAREHIAALQPKLSTLTIRLTTPPAGAAVTLDGQPFPAIGSPLPIDPGPHRIDVTAPGKKPWSDTVDVKGERQSFQVVVPALVDVGAAAPPPSDEPSTRRRGRAHEEDDGGGIPPVATVAFIFSGTAFVVGAATGFVTLGMAGDIKENCEEDTCPADQQSDIDSAETTANVSNVSFVLAAVGAAVGIGAILLDDDGDAKKSAFVEPTVGLGTVGARGRF